MKVPSSQSLSKENPQNDEFIPHNERRERTGKEWPCFLLPEILNNKTHRQEGRGTGYRGGPRKEIRWASIWRHLALIFYMTENAAQGHQSQWELPHDATFRGRSSHLLSPRLPLLENQVYYV